MVKPPQVNGVIPTSFLQQANKRVELLSYSDAGAHGEVVFNATNGANFLAALTATGAQTLAGKVLLGNDESQVVESAQFRDRVNR